MHKNGISMWFRFPIAPVEQQRPLSVHHGRRTWTVDRDKSRIYKQKPHALASNEYKGKPFEEAIKVELTFYRDIQKSVSKKSTNDGLIMLFCQRLSQIQTITSNQR